jgi:nicotinamide-nucleotide amidase
MGAEIIAIGTELLLGEIVDTNTPEIARALRAIGLDLFRTSIVGDNAERIGIAIKQAMQRAEAVITTGGLGPTVDDATRLGVASALGRGLAFHPELWEQIRERFSRFGREPTENNRRQAQIPQGAIAIDNPVGTAPGFLVEEERSVVICLPGVPAEMRYLLQSDVIPYLRRRLKLHGVIKRRLIRTSGVGESVLDEQIQDLETMSNPTVGVSAHPGIVDVRITAKAGSESEADEMIWQLEATIRQRLGEAVFGIDNESLEAAAIKTVERLGAKLAVVERGMDGRLTAALAPFGPVYVGGMTLFDEQMLLVEALSSHMAHLGAQIGLGASLTSEGRRHQLTVLLRHPGGDETVERSYGGPLTNATGWGVNLALDALRRRLGRLEPDHP